jgi:predicted ATPase/DNA-binding SARP family transcriptional activator
MTTLHATVPLSLTRFIGRDRELTELARLVVSTRLLTLTGAGGSGKTRLAGEMTVRSPHPFEQVLWTDLAAVHDELRIVPTIGMTLGVQERGDAHTIETVIDAIGERSILLVIDNCEHLVDACAGIAESLLMHCPQLCILATSREALGVPGETAWLVPPMHMDEAVQLFLERAQSVQPSFMLTPANISAVRDICVRLDGIPLAIELAAARVRVLSPQQIAERLSDAFSLLSSGSRTALARQRTLRGAIDWSFALLTSDEQRLLQRLSVFAGSFSIDAVEAICTGAPLNDASVLDELSGLVDKSLVVMDVSGDDARYRLLETVRQYGEERRRAHGECDMLRDRHSAYYLALAEAAEPLLFGGAADLDAVTRITTDIANLRAAFEWCDADPSRVERGLRGAYALHWYWFARGEFDEGKLRLRAAQRHAANSAVPQRLRGLAMIALGHMHVWQGNPQDALTCMQQGHDLLCDDSDPFAAAYALTGVGAGHYLAGAHARAMPFLLEAASHIPRIPDHVLGSIIHYWIGRVRLDTGDQDGAEREFVAAANIGRRIRHRPAKGHNLLMVGLLAEQRGQMQRAHAAFAEALDVHSSISDMWGIAQGLEGVACTLLAAPLHDTAAVLLGAATALRERIAAPHLPGDRDRLHSAVRTLERLLGRRYEELWSTGYAMTREAAVALALEAAWPTATPADSTAPVAPATANTAAVQSAAAPLTADAAPSSGPAAADLTIRMLGPLEILVSGVAVDSRAWGSARSRELLLFLVCHPNGATKEQVGAAFWPEASSAQVRNTFHVTLHRLRKALGHAEWVTVQQERYRLDPSLVIDCDALRFEKEMTDALKLVKRRSPDAEPALTRALSYYTSDLLLGESVGEWHVPQHDRLQRLLFDGLQSLSALHLEAGRFADAIATSQRLLTADNLDEDAWRSIMTAHARAGERSQALRVYQQVADLMQREIESEPDRATRALAQRIQKGETV